MKMYENHIQHQQTSSIWTQTQRNQGIQIQNPPQITPKAQKDTIIFKYPYLIQRSSQKIKQDNLSNKSTQKNKRGHRQRKKIFQTKSSVKLQMKQSTLSADRNRKINCNTIENNPIHNKLKNSKNKSTGMKKSQQSSFNCNFNIQNSNRISPITFHYSNPNQASHPSVCVSRLQHVRSIPAPLQLPISNIPISHYPFQVHKPVQQVYYSNPGPFHQPLGFKSNYLPNVVNDFNVVPSQTNINRYQLGPENTLNLLNMPVSENPYKSTIIGNQNQSPIRFKQISQSIHLTPIPQQMTTNENSPQNPQNLTFQQKNIKQNYQVKQFNNNIQINKQKTKQQKKSMFREYPEVGSQQSFTPNIYQTYKLSQKLIKNDKKGKQQAQSKKIIHLNGKKSPLKRKGNSKQKSKQKLKSRASLQTFQDIKQCQSQADTDRDLEQLQGIYEQTKYSDRFFDMDLKHHTVNCLKEGQKKGKGSNIHVNKNTSTSIEFNTTKFNQQKEKIVRRDQQSQQTINNPNNHKQKALFKKPSITSIALQRQKLYQEYSPTITINSVAKYLGKPVSFESNSSGNVQENQKQIKKLKKKQTSSQKLNNVFKFNRQIPIIVIFIGLGVLLVLFQILK